MLRPVLFWGVWYLGSPLTLHGVRRWLVGEVIPTDDKVQEQRGNWRSAIPQQELDVVEAFLTLPIQQRKIVREVILAFAKAAG